MQNYDATLSLSEDAARAPTRVASPGSGCSTRPGLQAFEQLQQVRGYYSVGAGARRRPLRDQRARPATSSSAVRELDQSGLEESQRNWANEHTVYTHGYGVIAAYGNQTRHRRRAGRRRRGRADLGRAGPAAAGRPDRPVRGGLPAADLLRRAEPVVLHRRQARRRRPRRRARHPRGQRRRPADHHDLRRQRRRPGRRHLQQAALRDQVRRAQHRAVEPGQRELQDPLRPAPARAGAEGRPVADRGRRRLPGGRGRAGGVDRRRLHDDRPLPERASGTRFRT